MSLIADALKAAQEERRERPGQAGAAQRRRFATSALRTSASISAAPSTRSVPRALWIAVGLFAVALGGAAVLVARVPVTAADPATVVGASTIEAGRAAARPVPEFPVAGSIGEYGDLDGYGSMGESGEVGTARATVDASIDEFRRLPDEAAWNGGFRPPQGEDGWSAIDGGWIAGPETGWAIGASASNTNSEVPPTAPAVSTPAGRFELTVQDRHLPATGGFQEAVAAQRRGDYRSAITLYERILERQPTNVEAMNNLGTSFQALGDLEAARTLFERAVRVQPTYAAAWSNLGVVHGGLGREDDSLAALAEAVRLDPANAGARVNLGLLYLRRGMPDEAGRLLEGVLRLDPDHAEAQYAYAQILERRGDREGAIRHYRIFLERAGARFPHLDAPVRQRIDLLEGLNVR